MSRPIRIGITSGDQNGIGPEILSKALSRIGTQKNVQFFLWRGPLFPKTALTRLQKKFTLHTVPDWSSALGSVSDNKKVIVDICNNKSPAFWVEAAAHACVYKHLDALVTGPLSKQTIFSSGLKDLGHTDILKRVSGVTEAYMCFVGNKFSVFLLTGHLPLSDVASFLTRERLRRGLDHALKFGQLFGRHFKKKSSLPIGVLGLNPHAGDDGLIGSFELDLLSPLLTEHNKAGDHFLGPLVPDAAFQASNWEKHLFYVALYHDQGLIPFKTVHAQKGVHLTFGLPFIRTSVDHGPAFDIAGKDKADYTSMKLSIELAIKLCTNTF